MKIAIMQPYFSPYIGYFSLIKHTEQFILLDTVQFIRHGWIERNRILGQNSGWNYILVPVIRKNGRETRINDVLIDNKQNWKQKIIAQLQHYRKIAPYYFNVINILEELFNNEYDNIVTLNKALLEIVSSYLEFDHQISVFSDINLEIETPTAPDEWALNICKAIGTVDEYWNPPGGIKFFERSKFFNSGINLKFHKTHLSSYNQKREGFESGLSIIDVMMFNSVTEIKGMLDNYELT
jgi:hypothetical protein